MDAASIISMGVSLLVGALVTAFFANLYYRKSSEDLRREARMLQQYNEVLLRLLDPRIEGLAFVEDEDEPRVIYKGSIESWLLNELIKIHDEQEKEEQGRRPWWRKLFRG